MILARATTARPRSSQNGKLRVNLGVGQDGPALDLLDAAENPRAQLMITEDQGPILNFYDAKGSQVSLKP